MHLGKRLIHGAGGQGRSFRLVRNPGGIGHAGSRFHTIPVYDRPGLRHFRFKGADQRLVRLFADGFAKALGGSLFFRAHPKQAPPATRKPRPSEAAAS